MQLSWRVHSFHLSNINQCHPLPNPMYLDIATSITSCRYDQETGHKKSKWTVTELTCMLMSVNKPLADAYMYSWLHKCSLSNMTISNLQDSD